MNVDEIREYCLAFPDATENLQWGDDLCFKIRGKIFVTLGLTVVPQKICFKCAPQSFAELIEREGIHPAPYVGRYQWVMLDGLDALARDEMKALIQQSYEMVLAKAPKPRERKATAGRKRAGARVASRKPGR